VFKINDLITINGVRGFIDENGVARLNLDDVVRGLGFTRDKGGTEYVMWDRVDRYLQGFSFEPFPFHTSAEYIPENIFYRLAMKAKNETAETFQAKVANEILPAIRKTGTYSAKSPAADGKYLMIAESLIAELKGIKGEQDVFKDEIKQEIKQFKATIDHQVFMTQSQATHLKKAVERRIRDLLPAEADYAIQSKKMFSSIWRDLKDLHQVPSYREIPRIRFDNAMQYVENWQPLKIVKSA
jgi:prophage antirepressor-like protein